jgi:uncharacterized damage-inducible protein DinB
MARPVEREAWQRGALDGVPPLLMPAAHALVQAREDLERLCSEVPAEQLWARPGGAASIGFHVLHVAGATDRLFTYARGEQLSDLQRAALEQERRVPDAFRDPEQLAAHLQASIERALEQLRSTSTGTLLEPRTIGRAALPTNTVGLLFHAAEHAMRHTGQAIATAKFVAASA